MATCGLRGPLSAVIGPCVDSYYCCIIPVWPTGHSRRDARMGPKMGGQLEDPPDSQEGESRPRRITFGGATPLTKPIKTRGPRGGEVGGARRGGGGGAGGGGPGRTAMCLLQAASGPARAGAGPRGRHGPTRPARTHVASAGPRGQRMSIPSG